jgi:hypothetical protein
MNSQQDLLLETSLALSKVISDAQQNFRNISEEEWSFRAGPDKWSRKEILGHLIDSAANNHLRFVRAQLSEKEFISFSYEQNFFVSSQAYQEYNTKQLTELWISYNNFLAHIIRHVDPSKLNVICRIGNYDPAPLSFIITDYVEHMKHHLKQIITKS